MATRENWNYKIAIYYKKCGCPFKLKGEQMAARLTEEQLQQTKQFRKSHVPPRNILQFFRDQDVGCAVSAQKIYNVVAKIKKNNGVTRSSTETVRRETYLVILSLHTQHQLQ
ncbi:hypothetical protein M9H77_18037 [Catharanthus roseus]|uniref:Uncharacterized protein n=1 Tax=Catharanthus roseus TaxID=4058 RepID=A0ACC0B6D1_CATRO|nr:hypothetical protein M9H77_18037 [Catharanthus roseus]